MKKNLVFKCCAVVFLLLFVGQSQAALLNAGKAAKRRETKKRGSMFRKPPASRMTNRPTAPAAATMAPGGTTGQPPAKPAGDASNKRKY